MLKQREYLLEKKRHGTEGFPCAIYRQTEADGPLQVKHHWHTQMEIIHMAAGTFLLEVNMEPIRVTEESFAFVNPEELHQICSEDGTYEESAVVFDWKLLHFDREDVSQQNLLAPLARGEKKFCTLVPAAGKAGGEIAGEYGKIMELFCKKQEALSLGDLVRVKAALLNIVALMEEQGLIRDDSRETENYRVEYLKKILAHIREHYAEKIKVPDLANLVGMNEQYFCRFFKRMLGRTPVEYINAYRVDKVKQALLTREDSILNAAMDCGFSHMGHFIEQFKKQEGCTPSEYRKCNKKSK